MSLDFIRPSIRQLLVETEHERIDRIRRAWEFYLGDAKLPLAPTTAESGERIDDNVRINLSKTLVSKGVSWLFGADRALGFSIEEDDADEKLKAAWPVQRRAITLHHLGINGGVAGQAFARLLPDKRVIVWDPSNVQIEFDDEDYEKVIEYRNTWTTSSAAVGDDLMPAVRRQRVVRTNEIPREDGGDTWLIVDEISQDSGDAWTELGRETHEYGWAPVFHAQNLPMPNEFWGEPDLTADVLDLIDAIQWLAGYSRKMIRHRGAPLPWSSGTETDKVAELNVSLGRWINFPNKESRVGQLEAAAPEGISWYWEKLWEAWHYVTRTPPAAFGVMNVANVKEETVELTYSSAVEKTWDKRLTYGPMVSDLARRILELDGLALDEGDTPMPNWPSIIPHSDAAEASAYEADLRMGIVSRETIAGRRGYEWETERDRIDEEAEAAQARFDAGRPSDTDPAPTPPVEPPPDE